MVSFRCDVAAPRWSLDDGVERWIRASDRAYFEGRVPVRLVGATEDFTDHKLAEIALRDSEGMCRTLAHNITQLAWMTDDRGWIFWYNRRWFEYTGTTLDDMQG